MQSHQPWVIGSSQGLPRCAHFSGGDTAWGLSLDLTPTHTSLKPPPSYGALLLAHTPFSRDPTIALTKAIIAWAKKGTLLCTGSW